MSALSRFLAWLTAGRSSAAAPAVVVAPQPQAVEAPRAPLPVPVAAVGDVPLAALCRAAGYAEPTFWAATLAAPMARYGIVGPRRVAAFLANTARETGGGKALVENLSYTAERIAQVWPSRYPTAASAQHLARNPEALANAVYGGRMGNNEPGDGWRFRGRGLIQVTGRANYERVAGLLDRGLGTLLPAMETPQGAAETAAAWWSAAGVNVIADTGDIEAVRRKVNGGVIGLPEVRRRYAEVLAAMGTSAV